MKRAKLFLLTVVCLTILSSLTYVTALEMSGKSLFGKNELTVPSAEDPALTAITQENVAPVEEEKPCVFKTVFGEQSSDSDFVYKTPEKMGISIDKALDWIVTTQHNDGGWSAGSHAMQSDPNQVKTGKSDPATTAMVSLALLRCGHTPAAGQYKSKVNEALEFLLQSVEKSEEKAPNITDLTGTQPQVKLGNNIDVIITAQFLTTIQDHLANAPALKQRIKTALNKCVRKIQNGQETDGSFKGGGWASVLQSSMADNALQTAKSKGAVVDDVVLNKSQEFHRNNVSPNGNVATDKAAGVVLYSVSSSGRSSAKEAGEARKYIEVAKKEGKINNTEVNADNLRKAGVPQSEALKLETAYNVNATSVNMSQREDVISGFGNNGGEEFLSYLQTVEGMVISRNLEWKKWYDNIAGRLLNIQENNGSWTGHHCITSPVFCTATCLLFLSVNNDIETLRK